MEDVYRTIDLSLAAYLKTIGYPIVAVEQKRNRRKATILIELTPQLEKDVNDYFNNKAKVDPRAFYDNVRGLKSQIVNECRLD
jgi:hypothetical protein